MNNYYYKNKYLKYKNKYQQLNSGGGILNIIEQGGKTITTVTNKITEVTNKIAESGKQTIAEASKTITDVTNKIIDGKNTISEEARKKKNLYISEKEKEKKEKEDMLDQYREERDLLEKQYINKLKAAHEKLPEIEYIKIL